MKFRIVTASIAIIAGMLSACSTPDEQLPTETPTSQSTPEQTLESSEDLQKWNIAASEVQATASDALSDWQDSGCDAMSFATADKDPLCNARLTILRMNSESVAIQWTGRTTSSSATYIGSKPESLAVHIDDVSEKVDQLIESSLLLDETCPDGEGCAGNVSGVLRALAKVETAFTSWP